MNRHVALTLVWIGALVCTLAHSAPLTWQDHQGHRLASLEVTPSPRIGLTPVEAAQSGIHFVNQLALSTALTNQIYLNGSGVALADFDGDDLVDIYLCGLESPNQLYRNKGNWSFEPVTDQALLRCAEQASTGATFADLDGDGDPDLLVNGIRSGTRLFLNEPRGQFQEVTDDWGLRHRHGSTSLAVADINGDGWLDLYVVNYRNETMRDEPDSPFDVRIKDGEYELVSYRGRPGADPDLVGRFTFSRDSGVLENGEADQLFLNLGGQGFESIRWEDGIFVNQNGTPTEPPYDWGLSAMFRDLNHDGWPDLYVCNDFQSPDRIWINDGAGSFKPILSSAIQQTSLFSMGLDVADINRDGLFDLFVVDMLSRRHRDRHIQVMDETAFSQYRHHSGRRPQSPRNTLLLQQADGSFDEIARLANVDASFWSWCPVFLDVDLDGYEDLLITTGHGRDAQNADVSRAIDQAIQAQSLSPSKQLELRRQYPELEVPNVAFRNLGNLSFTDTSQEWGFASEQISHGLALADLDNDGDQDLVATCLNAPPLILRNEGDRPRIRVRLVSDLPNTSGVGAKVSVRTKGLPTQTQEVVCGGRYLSGDDLSRVFALNSREAQAQITVLWQDGTQTHVSSVPANHLIEIRQQFDSSEVTDIDPPIGNPLFEDVSETLIHRHEDAPFEDQAIQPSLTRKRSEFGPGATWFDFNGDGWEDLFIGAGRGGKLGVFRNDKGVRFVRQKAQAFSQAIPFDHATILGWQPHSQDRQLLIGQINYESPASSFPALKQFSVVTGKTDLNLLRTPSAIGPLAMADADGDGDLDLFVGTCSRAGRYPITEPSHLLINEQGRFQPHTPDAAIWKQLGLVRSAVWTHLDEDTTPELVVATEWGALRICHLNQGQFQLWNPPIRWTEEHRPQDSPERLGQLTGRWQSISSGDFDGDGRLDLIAGNWGRNWESVSALSESRRLYFETSRGPSVRFLEAYFNTEAQEFLPVRDRTAVAKLFPAMANTFPTFTRFADVTMPEITKASGAQLNTLDTRYFNSVILLNRDDHFQVLPLPTEAQFAPVFGIGLADFNLDGNLDAAITQNFYATTELSGRQDAGGLRVLLGDGTGQFTLQDSESSGLKRTGQGRAIAVCDFNHDGRPDFVTTNHGARTLTFQNQATDQGIRVVLKGNGSNLQAVGTTLRLVQSDGTKGPRHLVTLGDGYWAQNATTPILAAHPNQKAIEVSWPNGKVETVPLAPQQRQVTRSMPPTGKTVSR